MIEHSAPSENAGCRAAQCGKQGRPWGPGTTWSGMQGPHPDRAFLPRLPRPGPQAVLDGGHMEGGAARMMVGRDRELTRVTGLLDDVLAGRGRLVLCTGEAGIGQDPAGRGVGRGRGGPGCSGGVGPGDRPGQLAAVRLVAAAP